MVPKQKLIKKKRTDKTRLKTNKINFKANFNLFFFKKFNLKNTSIKYNELQF